MTRTVNDVSWKIGGEAGFGIMATGAIFAKTCMRAGLSVIDYSEYPSLIRGGHNTYQVTVAEQPRFSHSADIHFLTALNRATIELHLTELVSGGVVLFDQDDPTLRDWRSSQAARHDLLFIGLPMGSIARAAGGETLMRNTVALGATFALFSGDFSLLSGVVAEIFEHKGQAVVDLNLAVLQAGRNAITTDQAAGFAYDLVSRSGQAHMLISGNEAIGMGALQAGCSFYAAYPMTPASSILHFLAEQGPKYGMHVRHAEDEIAVINETIGAAYAGARAMCGTAGGGFALMTEAVGMASMTEVGLVVIEAQRGGPSTGLPTWTEQGDLRQVLHASQGDAHKVVIAPTSIEDCFHLTQRAFDLADHYQVPVIVMTDKHLAEGHSSVPVFPDHGPTVRRGSVANPEPRKPGQLFPRYRTDVVDGISERTLPGMPHGMYLANSDEHDHYGTTTEEIDMRVAQMDKRLNKMLALQRILPAPEIIGPRKADVTLVSWGSSVGAVKEAARLLQEDHGLKINILPIVYINPWPRAAVIGFDQHMAPVRIMIEANQSGQMAGWIREQTGVVFDHHLRRYDGRPFVPEELSAQIRQLIH